MSKSGASRRLREAAVVTIEDLGSARRIRVTGRHSRQGAWRGASELDTVYSQELVGALYEVKGAWVLNEIERSEHPSVRERALARLQRYGLDIAGKRLLDFGCGAGASAVTLLRSASTPPQQLIGVDIDARLVSLAVQRVAEAGFSHCTRFEVITADDGLEFIRPASLDLVFACEVFEHIPPSQREQTVRRLWSKLAPGGCLYVTSPNRLSPRDLHTSGLWFVYWLPTRVACACARLLSRRCRGRSDDDLVCSGLRAFSYFELRRYLAQLSYTDLSAALPLRRPLPERGWTRRLWNAMLWPLHRLVLRHVAPYDAFAPHCVFCFRKEGGAAKGADDAGRN